MMNYPAANDTVRLEFQKSYHPVRPEFQNRLPPRPEKIRTFVFKYSIICFVIVDLIFYGGLQLFHYTGNRILSKVFRFLFYEFLLVITSIFLFKRIISICVNKFNDSGQQHLKKSFFNFALIWIFLTHVSYSFYYIPLPDDFFLPVFCFLAFGAYIHCIVILLVFLLIELLVLFTNFIISRWISSLSFIFLITKNSIFLSKTFHTLTAIIIGFILTFEGFYATSVQPTVKNLNILIRDLPPEFNGFSIALITDIHTGPTVGKKRVEEIVKITNRLEADVIAIDGDLVDGYISYIGDRVKPIKDLRAPYGVYATVGNHEYFYENIDKWIRFFDNELKIRTLVNDGMIFERGGKQLCFAGLDDYYSEVSKVEGHTMNLDKALSNCSNNIPTIVMAHQPNGAAYVLKEMEKIGRNVDLILSGHTHAGQVFVFWPFGIAFNTYFYGLYLYAKTGTQIFVSSGVNYWGPPVKMFPSLCEIVYVRLLTGLF